MWILLLVITTYMIPTYEVQVSVVPIKEWATLKDCEDERISLTKSFDEAYPPEERNYEFICKPVRRNHA